MSKSNVLTIVLSFLTGLLVSCIILAGINLIKDNRRNEKINNNQIIDQEDNAYIEEKKGTDNNENQIKTTERIVQESTLNVDPSNEKINNETQNLDNKEKKQEVKIDTQQQNKDVSYTNVGISSVGTTQNQTNRIVANSTQNKSNSTDNKKNVSETPQAVKQNTNNSNYYILNKNTKVFHIPTCKSVKKMKNSNKIEFHGSREEAISKGYRPCKNCNP